jgi:ferredoxin
MGRDWTREELKEDYIGQMKAVTIPVMVSFEGRQRILDMGEVESILRGAEVITKDLCYCRERVGSCIEPMDGCLSLNDHARRQIEKHGAEPISLEDALEALRRTHEAGLVHTAYTFTGEDEVGVICSCCSCCCHSLSAAIRFGFSGHVFTSKYIADRDGEVCSGCGTCVERCQFGAMERGDDDIIFRPERCFGCGVCLRTCPTGAIRLAERPPDQTSSMVSSQ